MINEVKVWNRGPNEYREEFKGVKIKIKPGGYVEMDYYEAEQFLGTFRPIFKDKSERQDKRSYKCLEIDPDDKKKYLDQAGQQPESEKAFVCHVCSKEFLTKKGLLRHIKTKHLEDMVDEEARDDLIDDESLGEEEDET
jgi:hypothetical protein